MGCCEVQLHRRLGETDGTASRWLVSIRIRRCPQGRSSQSCNGSSKQIQVLFKPEEELRRPTKSAKESNAEIES
jgi:hypothetical protein